MKSKWNINVCRVSLYSQCKEKIRQPARKKHTNKKKNTLPSSKVAGCVYSMQVTFEIEVADVGSFRCSASWSRKWQTSSNKWNYQHILCLQKLTQGLNNARCSLQLPTAWNTNRPQIKMALQLPASLPQRRAITFVPIF